MREPVILLLAGPGMNDNKQQEIIPAWEFQIPHLDISTGYGIIFYP
jgi:hypothetical protein